MSGLGLLQRFHLMRQSGMGLVQAGHCAHDRIIWRDKDALMCLGFHLELDQVLGLDPPAVAFFVGEDELIVCQDEEQARRLLDLVVRNREKWGIPDKTLVIQEASGRSTSRGESS